MPAYSCPEVLSTLRHAGQSQSSRLVARSAASRDRPAQSAWYWHPHLLLHISQQINAPPQSHVHNLKQQLQPLQHRPAHIVIHQLLSCHPICKVMVACMRKL
uniref:Uncharacterized protein n=1 Tax=Chlamydomonas euryale TaxID=1486919 RepID=A0A7R9V8B0_9CHLO